MFLAFQHKRTWKNKKDKSVFFLIENRVPSPQNEELAVDSTISMAANTELHYGKESRLTHKINTLFDLVSTQVSKLRGKSQNNAIR